MAGDWIVFEHATLGKPEVGQIADALNISRGDAMLALLRLWVWADQQTSDGHALSVTKAHLDDEARVTGMSDAMEEAGWLTMTETGAMFPHFGYLNGQTAKDRALGRRRKQRQRSQMSRKCPAKTVTKTGLEKRREEKKKEEPPPTPPGFVRFWNAWPKHFRKQAKATCLAKWKKKKLEGRADHIVAVVEALKRTADWVDPDRKGPCAPLVWLNQDRYDCELADLAAQPHSPPRETAGQEVARLRAEAAKRREDESHATQ